ncbi:uncharacterized protein LOC106778781 [Vigna radiata var. radiata]|uniref:Uncharacterized protein LOC106778781 n=1 Tax=Vigna radiata var. radiata TaxID=3916 RepID=A0A1S3VVB6_VIGRR|nr:uncharacterized protein LOC106778781 [Vigna radiata var. radiata]
MAEQLQLQVLQEMQRQMQEMRAEIAALRAERENGVGGPSVQSVNVQTIQSRDEEASRRPSVEEVEEADGGGIIGRGQGRGIGRGEGPAGRGIGRGDGPNGRGIGRGEGLNGRGRGRDVRGRGRGRGEENIGRDQENPEGHREFVGQNQQFEEVLEGEDQFDQAEGLHPFTNNVMGAVMPENKVFPWVEKYGGTSDPVKHLRSFVDAMAVYSSDELVWCRVFSLSLKDEALDWFHSLPPRSIDGFVTLRQLFSQQYASNCSRGLTYTALVKMKQGREESLKGFMERFNRTARQVRNVDQRLIVSALTTALRPGPFVDYLYEEEPQSMGELQHKLAGFIRIEEGRSYRSDQGEEGVTREKSGRDRRGEKRPVGGEHRMTVKRGAEIQRAQQYFHHTPLSAPRVRVLEEALRANLLTVARSPTPRGADESKHCRYHQNMGHSTEDCVALRDKLESLVQAGHLREFVRRENPNPRETPGRHGGRLPVGQRVQPTAERTEGGGSGERPLRGVINTISDGFAGGGASSAARKRHLRNLHSVNKVGIARRTMPTITFSDEDFHAPNPDQDDPMVITTIIARYSVGNVLIDQGSSANILYWKTFQQMDIPDESIMPFNEQILGFARKRVDTRGYVDLKVCLGAEVGAKELRVRFLLVEAETSYNVLLGRPCLNAFGAIVSTPHLTMKYLADDGTIWTVRADQRVARECYVAGLKVQPPRHRVCETRPAVSAAELDPREDTFDRVEPMGEIQPFLLEGEDRATMVGKDLQEGERQRLEGVLEENKDLFAWTASDMPGIHPDVISHRLSVFRDARPVSQKKRRLGVEKRRAVSEEVGKLIEAGFIREAKYTTWLANVVMVKKSSGKWRMCIDFTDLNKACPKDTYPLLNIDALVDGVSGYEVMSFLDAYSGYNQIPMYRPDSDKTAFITEQGTFCYEVMPFGLKNAEATYQRLMDKVFQRQIGRCMEVYVDDMVVRSRSVEEHLADLKEVMEQLRKFDMRLNPAKCTFKVRAGKFLGFMLIARGIEANPDKCKAVLEMRSPQTIKEVQRLVGRLMSLSRFIPNLAGRTKPIVKAMKKTAQRCWDEESEEAFKQIKGVLTQPPVMGRPEHGHELQIYLATSEGAISAALIQEAPHFKLVYFVSRSLKEAELRYQELEKVALSLIYAARRLRPYFQGFQVVVRTDYPIAKILRKPDLAGWMIGWSVELSEFWLKYEPRGSVRGQHLADFAVDLLPEEGEFCWKLSVDGSSNRRGGGVRVVLEGPNGILIEQSLVFQFKVSNNQAEYEALLAGMELARDLAVGRLECQTDS